MICESSRRYDVIGQSPCLPRTSIPPITDAAKVSTMEDTCDAVTRLLQPVLQDSLSTSGSHARSRPRHVSTCVSNHCSMPGAVLGALQVPDLQPGGPPSQPVPIVGFAPPLF